MGVNREHHPHPSTWICLNWKIIHRKTFLFSTTEQERSRDHRKFHPLLKMFNQKNRVPSFLPTPVSEKTRGFQPLQLAREDCCVTIHIVKTNASVIFPLRDTERPEGNILQAKELNHQKIADSYQCLGPMSTRKVLICGELVGAWASWMGCCFLHVKSDHHTETSASPVHWLSSKKKKKKKCFKLTGTFCGWHEKNVKKYLFFRSFGWKWNGLFMQLLSFGRPSHHMHQRYLVIQWPLLQQCPKTRFFVQCKFLSTSLTGKKSGKSVLESVKICLESGNPQGTVSKNRKCDTWSSPYPRFPPPTFSLVSYWCAEFPFKCWS